jgi:hypothetical protein
MSAISSQSKRNGKLQVNFQHRKKVAPRILFGSTFFVIVLTCTGRQAGVHGILCIYL